MATRGRAKRASAVIEIAKSLASGRHDLEFVVACDDDDLETQEELRGYRQSIAPSPLYLGEVWNRGCTDLDADIYCPLPDDSFIAAPNWDELIVRQLNCAPIKLIGWNDRANPGLMTLPIVGREWYDAAGLYPGIFPYWFYDTWVAEVYSFVTGHVPYLPPELLLVAKKGTTQRMRDLAFWWDVYSKLRPERLKEAERLRKHFNCEIAEKALQTATDYWETRDAVLRPRIPLMQGAMADEAQMPPERYMRAKREAEKLVSGVRAA